MSKITPLMTSLHEGHKAEERLKCIDNMLFNKCEDTKNTILQAFWWYRKCSVPLDKIKQTRKEISEMRKEHNVSVTDCLDVLDKLIAESEGEDDIPRNL